MWPFAVAVDSGKYFCMSADVIVWKPINWLRSIALQRVSIFGENMHWCRNWIVSASIEELYIVFAIFLLPWIAYCLLLWLVMGTYHNPLFSFLFLSWLLFHCVGPHIQCYWIWLCSPLGKVSWWRRGSNFLVREWCILLVPLEVALVGLKCLVVCIAMLTQWNCDLYWDVSSCALFDWCIWACLAPFRE